MTDEETAQILTELIRSPFMRQMLKDASPLMTDALIDRLEIVRRTSEEPLKGDFDV